MNAHRMCRFGEPSPQGGAGELGSEGAYAFVFHSKSTLGTESLGGVPTSKEEFNLILLVVLEGLLTAVGVCLWRASRASESLRHVWKTFCACSFSLEDFLCLYIS
ncbi:hypothetical protein DUNSADRAFT_10982 [Dunaliella salina]|uniref:Encoded protein n=1 Tax=Dunaliella salina TaxID=3046 RepID=A0ABQ7GED4_DUNSA|nr:hypothetical protein DUNSADRAFT_10982 [Dunaliella salina]|eukprot:KAF5832965.1 hypothetical protein DUNSADRAFT_10982 [Dunaliella salina]